MKVHIIYENYLKPDGIGLSVGGIQTYISNLIPIFQELGIDIMIHQRSDIEFKKSINNQSVCVHGYRFHGNIKKFPKYLFNRSLEYIDKQCDIIIFGTDSLIQPAKGYHTLAIQHGIFWDKPKSPCSNTMFFIEYMKQVYRSWRTIKTIQNVQRLICVDYNFVNWYRSLVAYPKINLKVIPNFSQTDNTLCNKTNDGCVRIIFARRLFAYRGTRIFATAIKEILKSDCNIDITIAGDGPDEKFLKQLFKNNSNVHFIKYDSSESIKIHSDKDIAVIPTVGSEGTSLSLLEAMAANCAVICSNVGGMTNIVLNRYNGLMINPNETELLQALIELIKDRDLREKLAIKGHETVSNAFSLGLWKNEWKKIIKETISCIENNSYK